MKIEDSQIFGFIKDYLNEISIKDVKKGEYLEKVGEESGNIYYILEGTIKIENVSRTGLKIFVDEVSEDEFTGHISKVRGTKTCLHCDLVVRKSGRVICIPKRLMDKLLKNDNFANFFYDKTSLRIYYMYKKFLLERLFTWDEIVAYHILENSKDGKFKYKSMYDVCERLNISRKGLYNVINRLVYEGCLEKPSNKSEFVIKDFERLMELASEVSRFYQAER